jgi:3'(2'), 5'-bisphosphate nucleotidase
MNEDVSTYEDQRKRALETRVVDLAQRAGSAILGLYQDGPTEAQKKADGSPITEADLRSERILQAGLREIVDLPVLSEEQESIPMRDRANWTRFWLVDPLDGTRDFVQRTGDFSVCVALVENGRPVLGVIHAPVHDRTWSTVIGLGVSRRTGDDVRLLAPAQPDEPPRVALVSRFHRVGGGTDAYLRSLGVERTEPVGSAIKFGRMAEGSADVYVRLGPTMEWDVGAGDIIVREAGLELVSVPEGERLRYNTPSLENPHFIVRRPSSEPPRAPA